MNFANQVMCLLASIDNTLLVMSESLHLVHLVVIFRHMYNMGGNHSLACVRYVLRLLANCTIPNLKIFYHQIIANLP